MKTLLCVNNISYSQLNLHVFDYINKYNSNSCEDISIVSIDQTIPFMDINTSIFTISSLDYFYDGAIIAFTIDNAKKILSSKNNSHKVLFLYDLDWMFNIIEYDDLYEILSNKKLKLIVRHESHVGPVKNLSNREPDAIIENFSLEKIWNLL